MGDFLFVINIFMFILTYIFVLRYNLHMIQLNGYKNVEHFLWIKKNIKKQLILCLFGIVAVSLLLTTKRFLIDSLILIFLIVSLLYFFFLKKYNNKKKLVYTARVKRMIMSHFLLIIILFIVLKLFFKIEDFVLLSGFLALEPFTLLLANLINKPLEKSIQNYYIKDAKKKLKLADKLMVIGVTGSYGKTSVKYYLKTLLQSRYNVLITPESYNTPMGIVKTIREELNSTHEIFVCEMGARYIGDIKEICDIVHPHHGVITSIGMQHLETFGNIDNIINTKFELADELNNNGILVLNADNEYIIAHSKKYDNIQFYGLNKKVSGYFAKDVQISSNGTVFTVVTPDGDECTYQMKLIGEHNVLNVLAAISISHKLGIPLTGLKIPVRKIKPVSHRMEIVKNGNLTIIDDAYNSNPAGAMAAINTLSMFDGLRILITPGMVELGVKQFELNYQLGAYAAKYCDYILIVGKENTDAISKGVLENNFPLERCVTLVNIKDALSYAEALDNSKLKYILLENDLPDNY